MAVYVTSDLHGIPVSQLEALLTQADFGKNDYLFILGDVIDRGEYGAELLRWLLDQPNVQLLLGNHEAMLLSCRFLFDKITEQSVEKVTETQLSLLANWMENGASPTVKGLRRLFGENPDAVQYILEYLEDAPLYDTVSAGDGIFCSVTQASEIFARISLWGHTHPTNGFGAAPNGMIGFMTISSR